jgi:hypothetical protein
VVLGKFSGIKNTVTREQLGPDELELAINVDFDDVGKASRRRGYKQIWSTPTNSLFTSNEGIAYGIVGDDLGIINPDLSFSPLLSGCTNASLCYVQVGNNIYFSGGNASISGVIDQRARSVGPWGSGADIFLSPVVRPTATLPAIRGRLIGKPPFATCLAYFNGRIYLAQGNVVWATELFTYNYVERVTNFLPFEAEVVMIGAVVDGLYVGTREGVWFLSGPFKEMKRARVMDTPVVPGSMVYVPGELANPPQVGLDQDTPVKVSILFMTDEGYCAGQDGGTCYNYTEDRVIFPRATSAAATFRRQDGVNQYVVTLNSAGTPSANTRIGDFVSAELVRADAWRENQECVNWSDSFVATIVAA